MHVASTEGGAAWGAGGWGVRRLGSHPGSATSRTIPLHEAFNFLRPSHLISEMKGSLVII